MLRVPGKWLQSPIKVALCGLGGTGGEMLYSLVKMDYILREMGSKGFEITAFDDDVVSHSNIGRTRFHPSDIGHYKAHVLAGKFNLAYGMDIEGRAEKFDPSSEEQVRGYDLIIGCTDSVGFRTTLGKTGEKISEGSGNYYFGSHEDILWLDLGNDYTDGQYVLGHLTKKGHEGWVPNVYQLHKAELEALDGKVEEKSSCSLLEAVSIQSAFINSAVNIHASNLLYRLLKEGVLEDVHGGRVDLVTNEITSYPIDKRVWSFMGYSSDEAA